MTRMKRIADIWQQQLPKGEHELAAFEHHFFPAFLQQALCSRRILEIGAGRGRMVRVLQRHGVEAEFVCIDLNDYVQEAGGFGVRGNAVSLPFRDDSFDLVYSLGVVEHFPQTTRALAEHVRVAKPGGMILVTVPHLSPYTLLRWIVWAVRFSRSGTFEETLGRNIRLNYLIDELSKHRLNILDAAAGGVFLPSATKHLRWLIDIIFPEQQFGAYCWVCGVK